MTAMWVRTVRQDVIDRLRSRGLDVYTQGAEIRVRIRPRTALRIYVHEDGAVSIRVGKGTQTFAAWTCADDVVKAMLAFCRQQRDRARTPAAEEDWHRLTTHVAPD